MAHTPLNDATRRKEDYNNGYWYPNRCERPGCGVTDNCKAQLKKCSGCKMVQYCCERHQKEDWAKHKMDCKAFKLVGLKGTFYNDDDMLKAFPLKSHKKTRSSSAPPVPTGASCPICGKGEAEVGITRTPCCHQLACDTLYNYQIGTYTRDICPRSHERYRLCGNHGVEDRCDKNKDWRQCKGCVKVRDPSNVPDVLWRGLNAYNFYPMLSQDVPRHSLCESCSTCGRRFLGGVEGYSKGMQGTVHCPECTDSGKGGFFRVTGTRLGAGMSAAAMQAAAAAMQAGVPAAQSPFSSR